MRHAFLLGGNGLIGRRLAPYLVEQGWRVTVGSRSGVIPDAIEDLGVGTVRMDRAVDGALGAALGDDVDVLVDLIAFTEADARQINALVGRVGSTVVISSASVYVDSRGRLLDEATNLEDFPELPSPMAETQPLMAPSDRGYSSRKVAMERALLQGPLDATIIRSGAIYGPGAALPRELFFVKRFRDGRTGVVLVDGGVSQFHTTSVLNLAALVHLAAEHPGTRVLNCGDPYAPTVVEIGHAIADALGRPYLREVLLPESRYEHPEFANPWAAPRPVILDMQAAEAFGYRPLTTYPEAVGETCDWLMKELRVRDWSDTYLGRQFNYDAENALLKGR